MSADATQPTFSALRHGLAVVPVHLIAEQLYCEQKVDLALDFPDVERPTPALAAGAAGHEALAAPAVPITPAELAALVEAGESVRLHEYGFRGTVGAVPVAGRPDAVFLEGRAARLVLEFKFSAWRRPFPSHRLQLLAYGYLLDQNGYDVSRLVCGVLMLPPRADGGEAVSLPEADYASCAALAAALAVEVEARPAAARRGGLDLSREVLDAPAGRLADVRHVELTAPEPVGGGALSLFPYDPVEAARRLAWAIGYWEGRRAPQLADNPNKCRRCAFLEARLCGGSFGARMI
jgi:hypothetical protein